MGVPKVQNLVQQLIYEHKVVLYGLLVEFAKVRLAQSHQSIQEFEDERRIGIALRYRNQVDVFMLDMAKGGRAKRKDGRAYLGVGDDLDSEDVGKSRAAIIAEGTKNEILALLIEDEDPGKHGDSVNREEGRWQSIAGVSVLMLELDARCRGIELGPLSLKQGSREAQGAPPLHFAVACHRLVPSFDNHLGTHFPRYVFPIV